MRLMSCRYKADVRDVVEWWRAADGGCGLKAVDGGCGLRVVDGGCGLSIVDGGWEMK